MTKHIDRSASGIAAALFSPAAFAAQLEDVQALITAGGLYATIVIAIVSGVLVYFSPSRDIRAAPLHRLLNAVPTWVEADALVMECVREMTERKIGALIVMNEDKLIGIFTEHDALKVLAAGRDPRSTRVFEVMTKDPYCVSPDMTVREAMGLVIDKHFQHLPIVENGKVHAVLSSRDLTHWLARGRTGEVQEIAKLAAQG